MGRETAQITSFSFFGGVFFRGFGRVITASQKNTESAASVCPDSAPIGRKAGGTKKIRKESPTTNLRGRSFFIGRVRGGVRSRVSLGFESRPRCSFYRGESQVEVFVFAEADFPAFVAAHSIVHAPGRDFAAPRGNRNALFHRSNELLGPQQRPRPTYGVNVIFRVELQLLLLRLEQEMAEQQRQQQLELERKRKEEEERIRKQQEEERMKKQKEEEERIKQQREEEDRLRKQNKKKKKR